MNWEGVILFSFTVYVAKSNAVENEVDLSSVAPLYPR